MSATITVDTREVERLLKGLDLGLRAEALGAALLAGGQVVAEDARTKAPRRTGRLAAAIDAELAAPQEGVAEVAVGMRAGSNTAWYGRFQEFGVKPHELATGRRAVRFAQRGKSIPFHPGHPAHPFLEPALEERAEDVVRVLRDEIARRVNGAA